LSRRGKGKQSNNVAVATKPAPQPSNAVINQMAQQYNKTAYSPNVPILPYPGMQPQAGPRQFAFPIATNLNLVTRDDLTPFEVLRKLADLYDGIRLCKQSWFDCAANLEPDIVPAPGLLGKNEDASKYADEIQVYKDFFEEPDRQHSIHEWMNAALDDLSTIDAVVMYPRLTRAGDLYSLDLIDGSTVKPLLDDRGRTPEPPFYAYEQIVYGAPSGLYTTDEMLYLKEHHRTHSEFGFSRVENILMRVNQALRKQNLDMSMFTDGNIPAGFVSPAADLGWTPDQLQAFQTILDSLYAGNDALRSRLKMMPPGSTFTPTNPINVMTDFDLFLFNVACASFGTTPAEAGFTDTVNRATGETQESVLYRRTLKPIAMRFARLFNYILKKFFNERRFLFAWKGYEASEDFNALSTAHTTLVQAGIESIPEAAKALKIPYDGPAIPRFVMTTSGPFIVDNLANKQLQQAQVDAQINGLQATTQQDDNGSSSSSQVDSDEQGGESEEEPESSPSDKPGKKIARAADDEQTGMMLAFMLDAETAQQLALPGGEPPEDLHITLAYLGDMEDEITNDKLRPHTSPFKMRETLAMVASGTKPLAGNVGGVGRFFPAETEETPVIALVDVPDLAEFRTKLVQAVEAAGYFVADNHGYTPHITLAYLDASEPMPIESIPSLPLNLNSVWLCVGNDRYEFPLGGQDDSLVRADLRKWRDMAVSRVQAGKPLRTFMSDCIPQNLFRRIESALVDCSTADEVKRVFERSQPAYGDAWWQNADRDIQKKLGSLQTQGIQQTRWSGTSSACDNCQQNIGQVRKLGEPFPSGAILAPAHNHCDCSNEPVSREKEK
jgi:2'-5' RNA ligase